MSGMGKSKIGYYAADNPLTYYAWNPFGMGCSAGCPGCWAKALSRRLSKKGCPDCLAFRPHMHHERLAQPSRWSVKPCLILCNLTNDWLDEGHTDKQIFHFLAAMRRVRHHDYITLTKRPSGLAMLAGGYLNEWHGLTIRNQADLDRMGADFFSIPGNLWVSNEPAEGEVNWRPSFAHSIRCSSYRGREGFTGPACDCGAPPCKGLICGHNNRPGAPGMDTLEHIKSTVEQCQAAGVACFVKQIWVEICPLCDHPEKVRQVGKRRLCSPCGRQVRWRLLRASHPDEYALYPGWARGGRLPWQPSGNPG